MSTISTTHKSKSIPIGRLELIIGCMYAGKSTEMIRRYHRFQTLKHKIIVINNLKDTRYGEGVVSTHDKLKIPCQSVEHLLPSLEHELYITSSVIMIEEAQFFDDLLGFIQQAVDIDHKIVVVSGLSADCFKKPFGQVLDCIPYADDVTFLSALCEECVDGTPAHFSKRVIQIDQSQNPHLKKHSGGSTPELSRIPLDQQQYHQQIMVGAKEVYRAVCRKHFSIHDTVYYDSMKNGVKTIHLDKDKTNTPFCSMFPFGF